MKGEQIALKKHRATNTKEQEVTKEAAVHLTCVSQGSAVTARHPQAASSVFSDRFQIVRVLLGLFILRSVVPVLLAQPSLPSAHIPPVDPDQFHGQLD